MKALTKTGKPVILILKESHLRLVVHIEPLAKAFVNSMLPDNYGGDALANLLARHTNFSGRCLLPILLFSSDLVFVGYDGKWILEKGDFRIQTGNQMVNVVCTDTKKWEPQISSGYILYLNLLRFYNPV